MAMVTAERTQLQPATKAALKDLLLRLADDSLILGHRNSEWTGQGPILEEDIAFSSMAQDKMGHAFAYYSMLHELGEVNPDQLAYSRGPEQYRCCQLVTLPRGNWAFSLVRQFFFAEADAVRVTALAESTYGPLAQLAAKIRGEVKYHVMHGRAWMKRLGRATDESRGRVQTAVDTAYGYALGMFEPTDTDEALAVAGISPTELELCERWRDEVEPILEETGLRVPEDVKPAYGGRTGRHGSELGDLLEAMQRVFRLDPTAHW